MSEPTDPTSEPTTGWGGQDQPARADMPKARCTPSLEELYRYMDGALDEPRQATVRSHLDACGGCGELYDLQAQFRRLVEMRCQSELPADLKDRVFGAITELKLGPDSSH